MPFKIDFFDGKSSKTNKATITVSSLNWKISYLDEFDNLVTVSWKVSEIKKSNVYTKGWVAFTYGISFPFQKIESNNSDFINYISNSELKNLNNKVSNILHRSVKKSLTILLLTIIGIGIGMYFFVIPTVATSFASSLNKKSVVGFGEYIFRVLSTDLDINDKKTEKLQDFVDAMKMNTTFPIKAYVADSKTFNAFALSGGKIIVFSALLEKIETESQLAALISHEISHIENRHVLKNVSRNLSGAIFISILFGDINSVTAILADNAHLFSQLSYTRNLEKEADIFGLEMMRKNKLNLNGMPQLFQILKKESSINIPTYFSNHPMLEDRIEYTQEIADKQNSIFENPLLKEKWKTLKEANNLIEEKKNE